MICTLYRTYVGTISNVLSGIKVLYVVWGGQMTRNYSSLQRMAPSDVTTIFKAISRNSRWAMCVQHMLKQKNED